MEKKTFLIFANHPDRFEKPIKEITEKLTSLGYSLVKENAELVIVFGGDGILLRAARELNFEGNFLLINSGHLGYYSDYSLNEYQDFLKDVETNTMEVERTSMYTIKINNKIINFINDVVIQTTRSIELNIEINHQPFTEVRSSGIVISTSLGSTGFSLSLDSPVMTNNLSCYQYAMIAPVYNRLFPNPINKALISQRDTLQVKIKRGDYTICVDGMIYDHKLSPNYYQIQFDKMRTFKLAHFRKIRQFDRIRKSIQVK